MSNPKPLQYRISTWDQLPKCLSNNSKDFKIRVTKIVDDTILHGTKIEVVHSKYGVLFATLVSSYGKLLSRDSNNKYNTLTPVQILAELNKFGFIIKYDPILDIPGDQIEFMLTLNKLNHFDKIRVIAVCNTYNGTKEFETHVVMFNSIELPGWIQSSYAPYKKEYDEAILSGNAFNVDAVSKDKHWDWSFLVNFIANINDIVYDYTKTQRSGDM